MASFDEIKSVRLAVDDPAGVLDIQESVLFPGAPGYKTAYLINGVYYVTSKKTGAVEADYTPAEYRLSDSGISSWVDSLGATGALQSAYKGILSKLGNEMVLVRTGAGAESVQFTALKELYDYYKSLITEASESTGSTAGKWARSVNPEIAGGNL